MTMGSTGDVTGPPPPAQVAGVVEDWKNVHSFSASLFKIN